MSRLRSVIVNQAKAWLGKKESNNSHREIIDVYNSHKPLARGYKMKYTDAWCSCFVSAVAIKVGYTDIIPTEVGCEKHIQLCKKVGTWVENENYTPKAGDIIFFDWEVDGSVNHVGIVEKVTGKDITVIEGNYNNSVARRPLKVNGKYIRGYFIPKYDKEEVNPSVSCETIHIVKRGETLSGIASKYNTNYRVLADYNKIVNPNLIVVGQKIKIPGTKTTNKVITYIVKKGDTLSGIAKKYNTTYQKIAKDNNIKDPNVISIGQKLVIK